MTYTIIDKQLRDVVTKVLRDGNPIDLKKIKALLDKGANPKADVKVDEFSAYSMVKQYNENGQYNAILEVFDEHLEELTRPSESTWEGMHE